MMVEELQDSNLVDPLLDRSTFSLFPRTFGDFTKATDDSLQSGLESVHSYLKSMALRSPNKLLEQANNILRINSEVPNSNLPFQMASKDKVGAAAAAKGNERPPERRPALNRKRARFSLKPMTSQPSLDVNPSLNIDQLEDPGEYFLAHEKLENAKMELRKQRGDAMIDSDQHNSTETRRNRRPGLLGKRASYKHHSSLSYSEDVERIVSSQGIFEMSISSPSKYISDPETTDQHGVPEERKISGVEQVDGTQEEDSIALTEERVGKCLDEFLSADCMDLDENGVVAFLQERLQFKPINLDKLTLPGLDSIIRNDLEAPVEQLAKPRKALTDIHNTIRRADSKTSEEHRKLLGVSACPQASPTPQKSPLASLSFLQRRISRMSSTSGPFSALGSDTSRARHSFSVEGIGKQAVPPYAFTDHLDACNHTPSGVDGQGLSSGELRSQLVGKEVNDAANSVISGKEVIESLASSLDRPVDENSNGHDTSTDVRSNGSEGGSEDKVEDVLQEAMTSIQPELIVEGLTVDPPHCGDSQLDQLGPTAGEHCSVDAHAETSEIPLEQNDEENELNSRTPPNMQSKPKLQARKRGKRTRVSHRQSLAGAGSLWESGVRRSNRIKVQPLEWWNGERFLYGRIHGSLETVIGLKYVSPAKDGGKPTVRVKSYVSDEYRHLVEQAGLH
ncbi:centromere protein C [Macadamia integrifolia]|uniref:centromere protein C n=1 Tax=Macadamia integrifolia TaxID=60698 RepID=UPI001C4F11EE|nr:centromere protein C [Macadamia integrifolia]